jgi:hypothetical protein
MKVKILEETGVRHNGIHVSHGDEVTVPDRVGAMFCANGWAEDLDGKEETGERRFQDNVTLDVENGSTETVSEDAG